jgi:hypothetical protein
MAKLNETAQVAPPAFLKPDSRVPASLRELLLEADSCMENGLFIGATGCAQRAVDTLLKMEKAEGSTHDARVRSFGEKMPGLSQLYLTVLTQLGDVGNTVKLPTNTLQPLLATIKAVAYEIYVATPERSERSQYIRRLLDASDRKPAETAEQRKATPATLASMGSTGA